MNVNDLIKCYGEGFSHLILILGLIAESDSKKMLVKLLVCGVEAVLEAFRYRERIRILVQIVRDFEKEDEDEDDNKNDRTD